MFRKRAPEELWKALEKEAHDEQGGPDDDVARAASRSVSAAEKDLADAGFDVEAEKAEVRAWAAQLGKPASAAPSKRPASLAPLRSVRPPRPRSLVPWIAAAAVVLLLAGVQLQRQMQMHTARDGDVAATRPRRAPALRQRGFEACRAERWAECLELFDAAERLDPDGDADPAVQAARAKALGALAGGER
jgi:hypothetical protein